MFVLIFSRVVKRRRLDMPTEEEADSVFHAKVNSTICFGHLLHLLKAFVVMRLDSTVYFTIYS